MEYNNLILVTWDFTDKSVFALHHAINMAQRISHEIGVIHIVKKASEVESAKKKIEDEIQSKFEKLDKSPSIFVKDGSIFTSISDLATELKARLVIMGTHGMKGMQKLLGSWALKVITGSKVPFIVVQDFPKDNRLRNIVLPVTYRKETKECINWANFFAKKFGVKFHMFSAKNTDTNFIKGVESNLVFINKFFAQKGIEADNKQAAGKKEFSEEVVEYAKSISADAIMVMTTKNIGFADYVLGAQEQYIIANDEQIPVICINPKPPIIGGGFSTSGG